MQIRLKGACSERKKLKKLVLNNLLMCLYKYELALTLAQEFNIQTKK